GMACSKASPSGTSTSISGTCSSASRSSRGWLCSRASASGTASVIDRPPRDGHRLRLDMRDAHAPTLTPSAQPRERLSTAPSGANGASRSGAGLAEVLAALGLLHVVGLLGLRRRRPGGGGGLAGLVPAGLLRSLAHRGISFLALDGTAGGSRGAWPADRPRNPSPLEDPGRPRRGGPGPGRGAPAGP